MAALIRCVLRSRNLGIGERVISVLKNEFKAPLICRAQPLQYQATRCAATAAQEKYRTISEIREKLDFNLALSSNLVTNLYSQLLKSDSVTENEASLLLFGCVNGPFDVSSQRRMELADDIWSKMDQFGVPLSTKLYNLRLKIMLATKNDFKPLEELSHMKSLGLNPNKITYGLLVEAFCRNGDIQGANLVMEAVKDEKLALDTSDFNSFVTGHLKAGSLDEAEKVVEVLKERGLIPNRDTYFRFAIHFAQQGDLENIMKYIAQADSQGLPLSQKMFLDIYEALVLANYSDVAQKFIETKGGQLMFRNTFQKACQLASEGYFREGFQLYMMVPKQDEKPGHLAASGRFLLKAMISNGQGAEAIMEVADNIAEAIPGAQPHRYALFYAYKAGLTDLAIEVMEMMQAKNYKLKLPYMIPAIFAYKNSGNVEGVYKATKLLIEQDCDDNEEVAKQQLEHLRIHSYHALTNLGETRESIVEKMTDHAKFWNFVFFFDDFLKLGGEKAIANAADKEIDLSKITKTGIHRLLLDGLPEAWEKAIKMLEFLSKAEGVPKKWMYETASSILWKIFQANDTEVLNKVLDAMAEKDLQLDIPIRYSNVYLKSSEELQKKMESLIARQSDGRSVDSRKSRFQQHLSHGDLSAMTKEEVEKYQMENPTLYRPREVLITKAMAQGNAEEVKMRIRELQASGFHLSKINLLQIIDWFTKIGDLEAALNSYSELKNQSTENKFKLIIPLGIADLYVKQGNVQAAVDMILEADGYVADERSSNRRRAQLISILKNAPTLDEGFTLLNTLVGTREVVPETEKNLAFNHYMRLVLEKATDNAEVLKRVEELYRQHHVFPCLETVMVRFIDSEDVNRLQKAMEIGSSVYGNNHLYHRVAISFIQCGMPSRAVAVLQAPGLKISEVHLINGCTYLIKSKQIKHLESLVDFCKQLPVSRTVMLKQLILGYLSTDDLAKAVQVLDVFNEEFITPEKSTLRVLTNAFKAKNEPIPEVLQNFLTPQPSSPKANQSETSTSSSSDSDSSSSSDSDVEGKPQQTTASTSEATEKSSAQTEKTGSAS